MQRYRLHLGFRPDNGGIMPSTIQSFFATIDPISPPPEQLRNLAFRQNQSHRNETFKLKLLRWRRRVLPPGLPAVRSEFQRHRLATGPYSTPHCTRQREQLPTRAGRIVLELTCDYAGLRQLLKN